MKQSSLVFWKRFTSGIKRGLLSPLIRRLMAAISLCVSFSYTRMKLISRQISSELPRKHPWPSKTEISLRSSCAERREHMCIPKPLPCTKSFTPSWPKLRLFDGYIGQMLDVALRRQSQIRCLCHSANFSLRFLIYEESDKFPLEWMIISS